MLTGGARPCVRDQDTKEECALRVSRLNLEEAHSTYGSCIELVVSLSWENGYSYGSNNIV